MDEYPISVIKINRDFKTRLILKYENNKYWINVREILRENARLVGKVNNVIILPFQEINNLIYYDNKKTHRHRLYISAEIIKKVFQLVHDQMGYLEYN